MAQRQAAADHQTRPNDPGCEYTCRLPEATQPSLGMHRIQNFWIRADPVPETLDPDPTALITRLCITLLKFYLGLPHQNRTANPLDWWKDHAIQFPYLTKLARKFLVTPASSVYLRETVL